STGLGTPGPVAAWRNREAGGRARTDSVHRSDAAQGAARPRGRRVLPRAWIGRPARRTRAGARGDGVRGSRRGVHRVRAGGRRAAVPALARGIVSLTASEVALVCGELAPVLAGRRVQKVHQPDPQTLLLDLGGKWLLLSAHRRAARIHALLGKPA